MTTKMRWLAALAVALAAGTASAADAKMKPFVLAARAQGDAAAVAEQLQGKLAAAGFEVAGRYAPYDGAVILAVTSPELRARAGAQRFGGYLAAQRVTVTKVGDEVQVAYTNPAYMAAGYRVGGDLAPVAAKLEAALGRVEEYGPKDGKSAKELRKYHYMMSMPYFDDPWKIAAFGSQADAVAAVEAGLASGRGGTKKVYRVDVSPDESVFGVALHDGCGADANVMRTIDFKSLRSTGHLPYEVLVSKGEVYALHAKFRIALNFTDLSMMGDHSFMKIRCAPDSIEGALKKAIAGK